MHPTAQRERRGHRLLLLLAGLLALASAACGPRLEGPGSDPERRFLSLGTAPPGGAFFVVGGALAEVLSEDSREGWQVTAEATKGSQENIRRLASGELDFALSNAAITYFAARGEGDWESAQPVRAVMTLAPNVALFVAPAKGKVRGIADLAGRRVVIGPAGAGFEYFVGPILEAHGLGLDDLQVLHNTQAAAVDMLSDGAAAAAFLGGAVPTASITQAASSMDLAFIPFAADAVEELVERYPFFVRATIPAGTYPGQAAPFEGLDVGSMHLITAAVQDEDLVYRTVRAIYEGRARVVERHAAGRAIQPAVVVRDTGTSFHSGAVRYYREIGIWPEQAAGSGAGSAAE